MGPGWWHGKDSTDTLFTQKHYLKLQYVGAFDVGALDVCFTFKVVSEQTMSLVGFKMAEYNRQV